MSQTFSLQKSRALLKEQGFDTWIVEKPWNSYTKRREDLFNFIDLVGIREDRPGVIGIQACGEDASSHTNKILEGFVKDGKEFPPNPYIRTWLRAGNAFFIWAWRMRGAKGKRKTYQLREIQFVLKDGVVTAEENPHVEESAE